jgi:hypothetical protein
MVIGKMARSAACQPQTTAIAGVMSPAAIPPTGTPVCLIEKIRPRFPAWVRRASSCAEEGLVSPWAKPITMEATTIVAAPGSVATRQPAPQESSATWLTRQPPRRATNDPAKSETVAPTA